MGYLFSLKQKMTKILLGKAYLKPNNKRATSPCAVENAHPRKINSPELTFCSLVAWTTPLTTIKYKGLVFDLRHSSRKTVASANRGNLSQKTAVAHVSNGMLSCGKLFSELKNIHNRKIILNK